MNNRRRDLEEDRSPERFALLGRKGGGGLEILAYKFDENEVLCLFDSTSIAEAFSKVSPEIRSAGWRVISMQPERLPELVEEFDYVSINPSPQLNSRKELIEAAAFARSLRRTTG